MKKWTVLLAAAGLLAACNDNTGTQQNGQVPEQDTVQEAGVTDETEMTTVHQAFPQLYAYLKKQDSSFSEDSFFLGGENVLNNEPVLPVDEDALKPFEPYLIYNSDSSHAVDLYSHNFIVVPRNGTNNLEESSTDAEAALIDVAAKTRRRIFFAGPAYVLWDAKWTKPDEFLLIGAETKNENKITPTIWQIRLMDTLGKVYTYQGDVQADVGGYAKEKLAAAGSVY